MYKLRRAARRLALIANAMPSAKFNFDKVAKRALQQEWRLDSRCKCGASYITNDNVGLLVCGDSNKHAKWERDNR